MSSQAPTKWSCRARACMPLKFWDESYLMATFLINHTPSHVIGYDTPIHRLLGHNPDYTLLRTFGFARWPNLLPYNTHKCRCSSLG
jgi:hypothetical protein